MTGVQTYALPILQRFLNSAFRHSFPRRLMEETCRSSEKYACAHASKAFPINELLPAINTCFISQQTPSANIRFFSQQTPSANIRFFSQQTPNANIRFFSQQTPTANTRFFSQRASSPIDNSPDRQEKAFHVSARTFSYDDCPDRQEKTFHIKEKTLPSQILVIQLCLLRNPDIVPSVDLSPAGQPRH